MPRQGTKPAGDRPPSSRKQALACINGEFAEIAAPPWWTLEPTYRLSVDIQTHGLHPPGSEDDVVLTAYAKSEALVAWITFGSVPGPILLSAPLGFVLFRKKWSRTGSPGNVPNALKSGLSDAASAMSTLTTTSPKMRMIGRDDATSAPTWTCRPRSLSRDS